MRCPRTLEKCGMLHVSCSCCTRQGQNYSSACSQLLATWMTRSCLPFTPCQHVLKPLHGLTSFFTSLPLAHARLFHLFYTGIPLRPHSLDLGTLRNVRNAMPFSALPLPRPSSILKASAPAKTRRRTASHVCSERQRYHIEHLVTLRAFALPERYEYDGTKYG